jgi:hypothetical protein
LKVPPSTPAETQELEARQTAHLRASRFSKEKVGGFSKKLNARKRKINMCGISPPRWKRSNSVFPNGIFDSLRPLQGKLKKEIIQLEAFRVPPSRIQLRWAGPREIEFKKFKFLTLNA